MERPGRRAADRPGRVAGHPLRPGDRGRRGPSGRPRRHRAGPFLAARGRAFPGGTASRSAWAATCSRAARAGTAGPGAGPARTWSASTRSPRTAAGCTPTRPRTPTCTGPPAAPGLASRPWSPRFYLRTHPQPPVMMQDTWTFPVQAAGPLLAWLHEILPGLHPTVEPVVAATRLPDVPLDAGVVRPPGPVLLLHTTAMGDDAAAGGEAAGAVRRVPAGGGRTGARARADVDRAENAAQSAQNPPGSPLRRGLHLERRAGGGVGARGWSGSGASCPPSTPSRSGTAGRPPGAAGHGVLGRGQRVPGLVPDLHRRGGRRAVRGLGALPDPGAGPGGMRGVPGRHRLPAPARRFVSDQAYRRLGEVRATWDPDGVFCSYLGGATRRELNRRA